MMRLSAIRDKFDRNDLFKTNYSNKKDQLRKKLSWSLKIVIIKFT